MEAARCLSGEEEVALEARSMMAKAGVVEPHLSVLRGQDETRKAVAVVEHCALDVVEEVAVRQLSLVVEEAVRRKQECRVLEEVEERVLDLEAAEAQKVRGYRRTAEAHRT